MTTLSLAMIVRDEELTLGRVLSDASAFCDQLVVVDTGSTDSTRSIAVAAGAEVVEFPWIDDFAAARNVSFEACTCDWIMWLDADDHVPPVVQNGILEAKETLLSDELDAVNMPYRYHFDPATDQCTFTLHRERIVRRAAGYRWAGAVHEVLSLPGGRVVARPDLYVEHRPHESKSEEKRGRNLRILERTVNAGDRSPRTLFYYGNELRDNGRHLDALEAYAEYLTTPAAVWERYAALMSAAECAEAAGLAAEAADHLFAALRLDPSRSEAFLALGWRHFNRAEWAAALPYYAAAAAAKPPAEGFVSARDYSWKPWDHLGVCLINLGRHQEGIRATLRSLSEGNPDVVRLRANLRWSVDQLGLNAD